MQVYVGLSWFMWVHADLCWFIRGLCGLMGLYVCLCSHIRKGTLTSYEGIALIHIRKGQATSCQGIVIWSNIRKRESTSY